MSYTDFDFPHSDFYDSDLRELIKKVGTLWYNVNKIEGWEVEHKQQYTELKEFMDQIVSGSFPPGFELTLRDWIQENTFDIIGTMIKFITVGLTTDGHLLITVPETWKELTFRVTGYDINIAIQPEFGHLCILY